MPILRVKESFSVLNDPTCRVYAAGDLVDSNDPVVRGREAHFETVEAVAAKRAGIVEQATAAPGERRSLTPSKRASKRAAAQPTISAPAPAAPDEEGSE